MLVILCACNYKHECWCISGTTTGSVLIYKLNTSCLHKELCIHNHRIQGVEWLSLQALVTFVHSIPTPSGLCRNEAAITDTQTGSDHFLCFLIVITNLSFRSCDLFS